MAKRLKELVVDEKGCFREHSGERVEVTPIGFPVAVKIPYDGSFDKRKVVTFIKNFLTLHQPQCTNIPGIATKERYSKGIERTIDYYLINLTGQVMGHGSFDLDFHTRRVKDFDVQGRKVVEYDETESRHHLGAIQFYRKR